MSPVQLKGQCSSCLSLRRGNGGRRIKPGREAGGKSREAAKGKGKDNKTPSKHQMNKRLSRRRRVRHARDSFSPVS
ncbi:uncharacterized [Tachysurus ichikawai]